MKCSAVGCTSNTRQGEVMLHRFPCSDPGRLKEWLKLCAPEAVERSNLFPKHKFPLRLCSKHFRPDQYYLDPQARRPKLMRNAVPFLPGTDENLGRLNHLYPVKLMPKNLPSFIGPDDNHQQPAEKFWITEEEEDESEDTSTIEVVMKEIEVTVEERPKSPMTTLLLENIQLRRDNQELAAKLALMEKHAHRWSQMAGQADQCVCSRCVTSPSHSSS